MTPREIALSICEPWFNGDPCEGCECHKVCKKLVERIEAAFHAERNSDIKKTSDHIADATKMVATIRPEVTVDTVQYSHIKELYSVDEIRKKIESNEYCAELLLQHAMMHLMGNVEPVAWLIESYDIYAKRTLQRLVFDNPKNMQGVKITAYYTAPPKREPLTDAEIGSVAADIWGSMLIAPQSYQQFARAIERAHGIGGEE